MIKLIGVISLVFILLIIAKDNIVNSKVFSTYGLLFSLIKDKFTFWIMIRELIFKLRLESVIINIVDITN